MPPKTAAARDAAAKKKKQKAKTKKKAANKRKEEAAKLKAISSILDNSDSQSAPAYLALEVDNLDSQSAPADPALVVDNPDSQSPPDPALEVDNPDSQSPPAEKICVAADKKKEAEDAKKRAEEERSKAEEERRRADEERRREKRRAEEEKRRAEEERRRAEEEFVKDLFTDFLNEYRKPGETKEKGFPFYHGEAESMKKRGTLKLDVDFNHLLTKKYKKLAIKVGNDIDSRHLWLREPLFKFLLAQGIEASKLNQAEIFFSNRPTSIIGLEEYLQDRSLLTRDVSLLSGEKSVYATTTRGRCGFLAVVNEILDRHFKDESFNGKFNLKDLLLLNNERCIFLVDPFVPEKSSMNPMSIPLPRHKVCDLKQIWKIMEPHFSKGVNKDVDAVSVPKAVKDRDLPIYFHDLKKDLVEVTEREVTAPWYRKYMRAHVALASSRSRTNLTKGLFDVTRLYNAAVRAELGLRTLFSCIVDKSAYGWKDNACSSSIMAIRKVYLYRITENPTRWGNGSRWHLLQFTRNLLQHGGDHCTFADIDELELLAAAEFNELLPSMMKSLFEGGHDLGIYESVMSDYVAAARHDKKDLPVA